MDRDLLNRIVALVQTASQPEQMAYNEAMVAVAERHSIQRQVVNSVSMIYNEKKVLAAALRRAQGDDARSDAYTKKLAALQSEEDALCALSRKVGS
jgi:hypothetical protein